MEMDTILNSLLVQVKRQQQVRMIFLTILLPLAYLVPPQSIALLLHLKMGVLYLEAFAVPQDMQLAEYQAVYLELVLSVHIKNKKYEICFVNCPASVA